MATFVFDGDGRRVAQIINGVTTYFIGAHYEVTGSTVTKYYFAGTSRIAMRKYTVPSSMTVEYLLGDRLGSTSLTTDKNGVKTSEMRYKPWGEVRSWWTSALITTPAYKLADYTFTGQYSYMDDLSTPATEGFGLMFYNARFYDPALGRFTSADTVVPGENSKTSASIEEVAQTQYTPLTVGYYETSILEKSNYENAFWTSRGGSHSLSRSDRQKMHIADVPLNVQALDRFAYAYNNPLIYIDPTGHDGNPYDIFANLLNIKATEYEKVAGRWSLGAVIVFGGLSGIADAAVCPTAGAATLGAACIATIVGGATLAGAGTALVNNIAGGEKASIFQDIANYAKLLAAEGADTSITFLSRIEDPKGWMRINVGGKEFLIREEWQQELLDMWNDAERRAK